MYILPDAEVQKYLYVYVYLYTHDMYMYTYHWKDKYITTYAHLVRSDVVVSGFGACCERVM